MPSSLRVRRLVSALAVCLRGLAVAAPAHAAEPFVVFETGQVRPLALSPDGTRLFAVNTPDNTLEVFAVGIGTLTHQASVPVGLEPIAVAARTDSEVWVVNHLSDSVSVVDLATPANPRVVRTLLVGDEPRDVVFAGPGGARAFVTAAHRGQSSPQHATIDTVLQTPGIGRADVWVFDATDLGTALGGTPLTILTLFGDTPRALAVSPDSDTVYAAVFHSGNRTTTLAEGVVPNGGESAGGLPEPNTNFQGLPQPEVGLIVQFDGTAWRDELDRDWSPGVRFALPDADVFAIDAAAPVPAPLAGPGGTFSGVGTVLFNMITNPVTGAVYVSNLESRNRVRFEGAGSHAAAFKPAGEPPSVRGHLAESRVTVLAGTAVTPRHLNKHIDYGTCCAPLPNAENATSLAFPLGMAITSDGDTLYVAGFGSSEVGVYDTAALEADTFVPSTASQLPVSGGGPTGLVLDEARSQLYVLTRFDDAVSVLSTATGMETAHVTLHNPEPARVVTGRRFLYDAAATSSHGDSACASCHVFGDLDGLAWDLGDPDGVAEPNPGPFIISFGNTDFAPMKGPMSTQSLRGMANHGPMHWRGDRRAPLVGAQPDAGGFDERAAFTAFNQAFVALLGRSAPLPTAEMTAFTDFILELTYPPNPIRNLDDSLTPSQLAGRTFYFGATSDTVANCNGCHVLDRGGNALFNVAKPGFFGTDGSFSFENETQHFKIPHLRNAYQKVGMFGLAPIPFVNTGDNDFMGDQIRGFGFLHDGSIDTVFRFHDAMGFNQSDTNPGGFPLGDVGDPLRRQVESFVHAFDTNLASIVGQQITLTSSSDAAVGARIDLFIARAIEEECDLIVKGTIGELGRGALYLPGNELFQLDHAAHLLADLDLRDAAQPGNELTYTCVPPGSGPRIGIDRDGDGALDGDELDGGSDPADPSSLPASACGADPSCRKCRRGITKAATQHVQTISKAYVGCEVAKLKGMLPLATDCLNAPDGKTQKKLTRAKSKLDLSIAIACGGDDKTCGGDADEPMVAAIGFPGVCPNFAQQPPGSCTTPIAHCGGVATCLGCIDDAAVRQAIDLSYGWQTPANPDTQSELNRCQQAVGRETQKFLATISKALAQCWDARNRGKHADTCPNPTAAVGTPARKAADVIARAASRRVDWICRNCGGDDDHCGGTDDFLPAVIGAPLMCPAVTVPGGAACARPIVTLQDLVDCTACVTEYEGRCMDRAAIPAFAPYPSACN